MQSAGGRIARGGESRRYDSYAPSGSRHWQRRAERPGAAFWVWRRGRSGRDHGLLGGRRQEFASGGFESTDRLEGKQTEVIRREQFMRFVMIGGFLGAGKTTTMTRLARHYMDRGQRVGLVTNDQAQDLVDTNSLRAQGFPVEEVAGACFCCRFDDLVGKVGQLDKNGRPDVILAEPVGSCTDLVATVVQPLRDLYGKRFEVAPYPVLFKPSHGLRILRNEPDSGFSPKAAYIFRKQLEEADAIVIN